MRAATFTAVACYSSTDLVHWTRQTDALSRQASGDLAAGRIVERPKVLFNSATGRYVMWMHIDNTSYNDQRAGVAVSTTPCGPYTYLGATRPLGHPSRDLGLFKDDDGTAYMIHEDPAAGMRIERLAADYTSAQSTVATFPSLESPAMAKVGGRYFLLTSHLTGWATNDNVYATATSLAGPWSGFSNFAVAGTRTYDSQTSFLLPVTGSAGTNYMYFGDRWNPSNLNASLPVWLPITLTSAGTAVLSWHSSWGIDAGTGAVTLTAGRLTGNQSGRCLDITGASQANGAAAELWDCNGGANQSFAPNTAGELRVYGSKCLEARGQGTTAGTTVDISDCTGGNHQKWMLANDGSVVGRSIATVPRRQRPGHGQRYEGAALDLQRRRQPEMDPRRVGRFPATAPFASSPDANGAVGISGSRRRRCSPAPRSRWHPTGSRRPWRLRRTCPR